jgi:hypothetical protein
LSTDLVTSARMPEVIPDARARRSTGEKYDAKTGLWWVKAYCINCGKGWCWTPKSTSSIGYLCPGPCAEKYAHKFGVMVLPDEVHVQVAIEEQLNTYGRVLTVEEQHAELENGNSPLAKLARDIERDRAQRVGG